MTKCPFNIGDRVRVSEQAEIAHGYRGRKALIVDCSQIGKHETEGSGTLESDSCVASIQFENEEILRNVPSNELISL
jgi:hypothetical protein